MESLVRIDNLKKYFKIEKGLLKKKTINVKAVDNIELEIYKGETFGLVGESGSGKTTVARLLLNFTKPTTNTIYFDGIDIFNCSKSELSQLRKRIGVVFQDPAASLNPRSTIYDTLRRPLEVNNVDKSQIDTIIKEIMSNVNLGDELLSRYPHQLSGGQQQRVSVARSIILKPDFLVLDEPTSALDISVQAQVLNLLLDIQKKYDMTYLFISHNLSVVRYISDRIGVMYLGKIVEIGTVEQIYKNTLHPYTVGLLTSEPALSPKDRDKNKLILEGEAPSMMKEIKGCNLSNRCPFKKDLCDLEEPKLVEIEKGHRAACHFAGELEFKD